MEYKFSKNLGDITDIKKKFFVENDKLLERSNNSNKFYNKQKIRKFCKVCQKSLEPYNYDFKSHGVEYKICRNCNHLNGLHEDSKEFADYMYKGTSYSKNYMEDYEKRIEKVYLAKAKYLKDSLKSIKNIDVFDVSDFGCGGGHFVNSLQKLKVDSVGYDISNVMIDLAKDYWKYKNNSDSCSCFNVVLSEQELYKKIQENKKDVSSFIGVLEHLSNPNNAIEAFLESKSKYMFFSVPLFSLSVFFENAFQNIFPRQLGAGHTHLYTFESINYFCKKYKLKKLSQWHFGTDSMDLQRSLLIELDKNKSSDFMIRTFQNKFMTNDFINQIQEIIDKNLCGSEVHMLVSK